MRKNYTLIAVSLLFVGTFVYWKDQPAVLYDSSSDGSEMIKEQTTIPLDVQKHIEEERLAKGNATAILGTQAVRVPVLMYHYVENVRDKNDTTRISLNTPPYTLEDEIKTLSEAGYTFMTGKELIDVVEGRAQLPNKPILLTFDDGYRDFYTDAYPILKKYHAKATQFVISGFVGYGNHLSASQLVEIANDGLVEIGAHTVRHAWLKDQPVTTVFPEIAHSKASLEALIHAPVVSFAYPFGAFDQQALEAVRNAGFQGAFSTVPGVGQKHEQRYFFYRLRPGGRTGQALLAWLESQQ